MAGPNWMSQRAYSKHRGVSHTAVRKAIRDGRITDAVYFDADGNPLQVDQVKADQLWPLDGSGAKKGGRPPKSSTPKSSAPKDPPPSPPTEAPKDTGKKPETSQPAQPTASGGGQGGYNSLTDSRAEKEHWHAKRARLNYYQEAGKLVDADAVRQAAYDAGRLMRDAMEGIPDRIADSLAIETDPHQVHQVLLQEIRQALESAEQQARAHDPARDS
ncbi:MAG: hypothetical protein ACLFQ3_06680 [Thiohalorhabdus sp.]